MSQNSIADLTLGQRPLFGGAITMDVPVNLLDVSDLRQVPDTQEAFVDTGSDISLILEILQRVEPEDPKEAAQFLFDSLAHDNDASSSSVSRIDLPASSFSAEQQPLPIILEGTQLAAKFNKRVEDQVHILMAIYRISSKNVDLVLSANIPISRNSDGPASLSRNVFETIAKSMRILDKNLFA